VSELFRNGKSEAFKTRNQEMGYTEELMQFVDCVAGRAKQPVPTSELFATMDVIFSIEQSLATGQVVTMKPSCAGTV
jgi:predicted dehydrogenase